MLGGLTWIIGGELYFLNNPANQAEFQYFSPNKLIVKVDLKVPDTLIINQNYNKYWRCAIMPINHNNFLAFKLDKIGLYPIELNYLPLSFYAGLGISLLTLAAILYYLKMITCVA